MKYLAVDWVPSATLTRIFRNQAGGAIKRFPAVIAEVEEQSGRKRKVYWIGTLYGLLERAQTADSIMIPKVEVEDHRSIRTLLESF